MQFQALLKRHFWAVGALSVILCAFFAAKIVGRVIEGKYLADSASAPRVKPLAPAPGGAGAFGGGSTPGSGAVVASKDSKAFEARNMFCSTCVPVEATPVTPVVVAGDGSVVPLTTLSLQLVATSVGGQPQYSFATVVNTTSLQQGGFFIGDKLPGAGPIRAIRFKSIDFENPAAGNRLERLSLLGEAPPPVKAAEPVAVAAAPTDTGPKDELQLAVDAGIKKVDDTTFEISRALVEKVLANPMAISKGARVVASVKNGKPDGIKMYAIKPSSAYSKLGFSNGDTLHSINGLALDSLDKGLEIYTKLKEVNALQVEVTRRGKPVTLNYTIR